MNGAAWEKWTAAGLIVAAVALAIGSAVVSATRSLTALEGSLLQSFALMIGLAGSFIFGQQSAHQAARDIIKPHARSAFRRLTSLYKSLRRVSIEVTDARSSSRTEDHAMALARVESIVIEQLATADDALLDWEDIVPEDVQELRNRLVEEEEGGDHD